MICTGHTRLNKDNDEYIYIERLDVNVDISCKPQEMDK